MQRCLTGSASAAVLSCSCAARPTACTHAALPCAQLSGHRQVPTGAQLATSSPPDAHRPAQDGAPHALHVSRETHVPSLIVQPTDVRLQPLHLTVGRRRPHTVLYAAGGGSGSETALVRSSRCTSWRQPKLSCRRQWGGSQPGDGQQAASIRACPAQAWACRYGAAPSLSCRNNAAAAPHGLK